MKIINRKARFNYELGERIEAGIVLTGAEVKSVKLGQADLGNAYVKIQNSKYPRFASKYQNEVNVIGLKIFPYKHADNENYDPTRTRKLLLHQREILGLLAKMKQTSRMLVPTAMYTKSDLIKIELALARGKKKYEKRETIKKREWEREVKD